MASRLQKLRKGRGLSLAKAAGLADTSPQQIERLEKGQRRLTEDWARRLARAYGVAPQDVLASADSVSVPVAILVASAFAPERPEEFDLPEPHRWVQAPAGLDDPEECFAAAVEDDSADRLYPKGSLLFVRRMAMVARPLRAGRKVVVRVYADGNGRATTMEILAGVLGASPSGDIVVFTRSGNRQVPAVMVVQRRSSNGAGLAERFLPIAEELVNIDYVPRADDPATLIGVVEYATTPE
jgi:transcriptional regulator with XRE-family HTH domain